MVKPSRLEMAQTTLLLIEVYLEVWVRGLYNSWWFCVHQLFMFIYLSMLLYIGKRIAEVLQRKFCKIFTYNPSTEVCTFLFFFLHNGYWKFGFFFAYLKCIFLSFFGNFFFAIISIFANLQFFADSKSTAFKSLPITYHLNWPPCISHDFQVPQQG